MSEERRTARLGRPPKILGEKPTKERIFEAALDLFAEKGYDRTSVRQIAAAVGLTESAVYRHFSAKEAILDAIFAYAESLVFTPLPDEEGEERRNSLFWRMLIVPLETILADPHLDKIMRVMYAEMLHDPKIRDYYREEYVVRANDLLESIFKEAMEQGAIRVCDARALAVVFNSFRSEWMFQTFIIRREDTFDIERIKDDLETPIRFFETLFAPETRR